MEGARMDGWMDGVAEGEDVQGAMDVAAEEKMCGALQEFALISLLCCSGNFIQE